jgi:hypothetical protein
MREKGATELALTICERLSDFPAIPDFNQLNLPLCRWPAPQPPSANLRKIRV